MTTSAPDQTQYSVTRTLYLKNKAPLNVNLPVPPEHAWLYVMLEDQTNFLKKINDKLAFIVLIIILAVVVNFLASGVH